MGDFFAGSLCYDQIAARDGDDAAQKLWEKNGGTGKYVNGMVAVAGFQITESGTVTHFKTEPRR